MLNIGDMTEQSENERIPKLLEIGNPKSRGENMKIYCYTYYNSIN